MFERIGRYEVVAQTGGGALVRILEARAVEGGELVILKHCVASDAILRQRFFDIAEVAAGLEHPNIVSILDLGREGREPFVVEERLDGESLAQKIAARQQLPDLRRLDYLVQVAAALEHAHAQGVLHRALVPAAVWVLATDRVKVTDFGLGALLAPGTPVPEIVDGATAWTLRVAPEQVLGREPDARSDVFCFGALGYELLTCRPPFTGATYAESVGYLVETEPPSVKALSRTCPAELANLLDRCLRKDPERRPQSFREVHAELSAIAAQPWVETVPNLFVPGPADDEEEPRAAPTAAPGGQLAVAPASEVAAAGADATVRPTAGGRRPALARLRGAGRTAAAALPGAGRRWRTAVRAPWLRAAMILAAAILVLGFAWWLGSRGSRPAPPVAAAEAPRPAPEPAPPTETGLLQVDAGPWGEVSRLVGPGGEELDLPPARTTPLGLRLPPGRYQVYVGHPSRAGLEVCEVELVAAQTASCRLELARVDVDRYFRESGWWR